MKALERRPFAIVGHRGAAGLEPENTIKSIKRALEIGVDIIEIDVRSTKDGALILLHDEDFKRLAGVKLKARDLLLNEIKEKITIKGEEVATLEDAISVINGKVGLFIEVKEPETTLKIIDLIKAYNATSWIAIISFFDEALITARKLLPDIITGLIYARPPGRIFEAKKLGANIVLPRYTIATKKANSLAHKLGLYVVAWTVNDIKVANRLIQSKIDAIATDYPDKLIKLRASII